MRKTLVRLLFWLIILCLGLVVGLAVAHVVLGVLHPLPVRSLQRSLRDRIGDKRG